MDTIAKSMISESSNNSEKKEIAVNNKKSFPFGKKLIVLIAMILFLLCILFLSIFLFQPTAINPSHNPTENPPSPSITPVVTIATQRLNIYAMNASSFTKVTSILPEKGFQGQNPVIDTAGNIYYVDQNLVMQFSLQNQESRVLYTNSKIGTKISNLTFISPSLLYMSVILNPLDPSYSQQPDPNSHLIEYNLETNNLRTIGPFPTLTNGTISYLYSYAGSDIINYVKQTYCKGEGSIYAYSSGSATFISKDGVGCNGNDPYLIGSIASTNSLILSMPYSNSTPDGFVSEYGLLYTYNVSNPGQSNLFDLGTLLPSNLTAPISDMPNQINKFAISDDNQSIYYLLGTKVYVINVGTRMVTQTIDLSKFNGYTVIAIVKNKVYLFNSNTNTFAIVDIATNTITHLSQSIITDPTQINAINYLGNWNNQVLFYTQSTSN